MIPVGAAETFDKVHSCLSRPRSARGRRVSGLLVAALLLASALPALAQERPIQIGVLALGPRNVPAWHCGTSDNQLASAERRRETMPFYVLGLRDELEKLRYVENRPENLAKPGRRFDLDLRMGTLQEVRRYARDFVHKHVDMIVAVATATVQVAMEESRDSSIPILMTGVSDPVGEGFMQSLARPGGFITGVSHQLVQGSGKRVELFKEMIPGLRRLITIRRPGYKPSEDSMEDIRAVAGQWKIEVLDWGVTSREELQVALAKAQWKDGDGIMILPDSLIISNVDLVLETSLEQRVPAFGLQDFMADWGALGAYGPSAYEAGGRDALYIDKITKGARPGDLPVEPVDPVYVINLKTAACLGVSLPLKVLHQADRVIR
ncbi:MAG TPA: ABC transporter substrate-binding protein [Xanthobacteraceae bacterium]